MEEVKMKKNEKKHILQFVKTYFPYNFSLWALAFSFQR